jgi:Fe-S cluster assembly protein SufD
MTQVAEKTNTYLTSFARFSAESGANGQAWVPDLRRRGIERFEAVGFPTGKEELWRFTSIAPVTRTAFHQARAAEARLPEEALPRFSLRRQSAAELVFVNGYFAPSLSRTGNLPSGVRVGCLADLVQSDGDLVREHLGRYADIERNAFVALNQGFIRDGAFVHVQRGATVDKPIHLLFLSTAEDQPAVAHTRVLVVAEDTAQATIVESYAGASGGLYFTNAVTEIVAGDDAHIDHYKLQQESREAYHVSTTQTRLGRAARITTHAATLGGLITRNDVNAEMAGEGAYATLNGLVLLNGSQHCDNHTLLDHAEPNCPSHELYKHVLDGTSSGVFKGQILVRQKAQKTDSKQTSKTLLLSDTAAMNSMPALEIYADDVKCTHGSTIGPVDEGMVFYLRTRGVGLEAARHLLTYAFAADLTRRIKVEAVRRYLEDYMAAQHGLPQDLRITDVGEKDLAAL